METEFDAWALQYAPKDRREALAAWNAALSAVEAKMPGGKSAERPESKAGYWLDGFNTYRVNALFAIALLRAPPSQPGQPSERGTKECERG